MNRRELLRQSAAFGFMAAIPFSVSGIPQGDADPADSLSRATKPRALLNRLKPPEHGPIPVACLISDDAVLIDFGGPWEVFGNVMVGGSMDSFRLYTVAETTKPIRASGGMQIVPDYSIATAPAPRVIVIPAQGKPSEAVLEWIRKSSKTADITMSVCTGAYVLAQTGLLAGKTATTHHAAYVDFARKFPDIHVKRGVRYVDDGNLASAGGLACGIDLALHVVERYYGEEVARQTAYELEYQGQGWLKPDSNTAYLRAQTSANDHPLCPVCSMDIDQAIAPSAYKDKTYHFCSQDHKSQFDASPALFVTAVEPT